MHGDPALATRIEELLGSRHPVAAAALISPRDVTVAARGVGLDTAFEIGSISKAVTGLLYADALDRGEIRHDSALGESLPLGEVPAARLTLAALSRHRSGLPGLPRSARPLRRAFALWRHGVNPYDDSLRQLLAQARTVRVVGPLGLAHVHLPATADELGPDALVGRSSRGRPRQPWAGEAIGPAGGIRASIQDMARLMAALLDGSAPGIAALDPVAPFGKGARIGAGWITIVVEGRQVVWHNGGTGGFRSWAGLDRESGTGAVILSATSASVDRHGLTLLAEHTRTVTDR
ncbi:serine hydrolase domain-containing protein [Nonomuraea sp. NPDC050643]|uniref:serine hydrolase domain-containing protein n=1 Tax=Nonomuraea sp. NPDC050643 TaxID=3155660 RepID=UPI0033D0AE27